MTKTILILMILGIAATGAWIRLAPFDAERWHVELDFPADADESDGVKRIIEGDGATFAALERIILATPRTKKVAGGLADALATYVTRSEYLGFPDYTTVDLTKGEIRIWGRSRFGGYDWGVNKARVDGWLRQLTRA